MHAVEGAWGEWDLAEVSHARINHRAVVGLVGGLQHPLRLPRKVGGLVVVVVSASLDQEVSSRLGERDDLGNDEIFTVGKLGKLGKEEGFVPLSLTRNKISPQTNAFPEKWHI